MKRVILFLRYLYTLDAYVGCEKITAWDIIYKKRIGIKRAWSIASYIDNIKPRL